MALQIDATGTDFGLTILTGFGYTDMTNFIIRFLVLNRYTHITVIRDDSYSFFSILSDNFMRVTRDYYPAMYLNSVSVIIRTKRATLQMYKQLLVTANDRSRGMEQLGFS